MPVGNVLVENVPESDGDSSTMFETPSTSPQKPRRFREHDMAGSESDCSDNSDFKDKFLEESTRL